MYDIELKEHIEKSVASTITRLVVEYGYSINETIELIHLSTMDKEWERCNPRYITGNGGELARKILYVTEKYREETKFEKMEYEKYIWLGKLIFKVAYKKNAPLYNTAIEILNKMNDEIDNIITLAVINGINVDSYVNKYIDTTY